MNYVTTIVARRDAITLTPAAINQIRNTLHGAPPVILSPGEAIDIPVSAPPGPDLLLAALEGRPIDAITVKTRARRKAVLVADMDSTIVSGETLDELAGFAGVGEKIAAITRRTMQGELDFKDALRERVAMLKGLNLGALEKTWERVQLTPGARELVATMRAKGALTALVSGGFTFFTGKVAAQLGFDVHRSNSLLDDGAVLSATLAVGDGANDLDMIRAAGLGVAFHAKPIVAKEARAKVDHADLRALLFAQGYPASEFAGG